MTFKRYEIKYRLSKIEYQKMKEFLSSHMTLDKYGKHNISNVYFDTNDYQIIRKSLEKPVYKEKLRVRRYAQSENEVFIELKKKYDGIVYKRRICMDEKMAESYLSGNGSDKTTQISKEIDYFMKFYDTLHPAVNLSYDREAYFGNDDNSFRVTFDTNVLMSVVGENKEYEILDDVIMEVKTTQGLPNWLTAYLTKNKIYKASFSKYGEAYKKYIAKKGA